MYHACRIFKNSSWCACNDTCSPGQGLDSMSRARLACNADAKVHLKGIMFVQEMQLAMTVQRRKALLHA